MERQYLTFERANYMCPDMHFAISLEVKALYSFERVTETVKALSQAHPFLCCVISEEDDGRLYYDCGTTNVTKVAVTESGSYDEAFEAYSAIADEVWDVSSTGLLRIFVYPADGGRETGVIMAAHHTLGDGRSILSLAMEFADFYAADIIPQRAEERIIRGIEELPDGSELKGISRYIIDSSSRNWRKENKRVSMEEYAGFVSQYGKSHPKTYKHYTIESGELTIMLDRCKENGVSLNDLLMAEMYIKTGTKKIIIAADIRKKLPFYVKGAMGNYATAMGIECRSTTADVYRKAREVHKIVQKHMSDSGRLMMVIACYMRMDDTLIDAAPISGLGGYDSKAGRFVGGRVFGYDNPQSFSITNLGKAENVNISRAEFIPPASPAARLTLGVLTMNGILRACSSETAR